MHRLFVASFVLVLLTGCAAPMRDLARAVVPGVVDGAVQGIANPDNQNKLAENLQEGAVREGTRRLSSGVLDGAIDTLSDEQRKQRLDAFAGELQAATQRMIQASVTSAIDAALSEKTETRIRALLRGIIADVVVTLFSTIGAQLGSPEVQLEAVGKGAREITRQITLGFQDAVDDSRLAHERGELPDDRGSLLAAAGNMAKSGDTIVYGLGAALVLVIALLIVMFIMFSRRFKLHKAELEERDAALLLAAESIKPKGNDAWASAKENLRTQRVTSRAASTESGTV